MRARGERAAHFIEHMLFKGTRSRTAAQLAEEMDAVGGQINAFTTKECTCFYARVLDTTWPGRRTSCATCSSTPGSTTPTWRPSGGDPGGDRHVRQPGGSLR